MQAIVEKNDRDQIFTDSANVLCIVDGDVYPSLSRDYSGPTRVVRSPVEDIEKYILSKRTTLLREVDLPDYQESDDPKRASKTYWKWLIAQKNISKYHLFQLIVEHEEECAKELLGEVKAFLGMGAH